MTPLLHLDAALFGHQARVDRRSRAARRSDGERLEASLHALGEDGAARWAALWAKVQPARLLRMALPDAIAVLQGGDGLASRLAALVHGLHAELEGVYRHYAVTTEHWSFTDDEQQLQAARLLEASARALLADGGALAGGTLAGGDAALGVPPAGGVGMGRAAWGAFAHDVSLHAWLPTDTPGGAVGLHGRVLQWRRAQAGSGVLGAPRPEPGLEPGGGGALANEGLTLAEFVQALLLAAWAPWWARAEAARCDGRPMTAEALLQPVRLLLHEAVCRAQRIDVHGFRRRLLASHPLHVALAALKPLLSQLFAHFRAAPPPAEPLPPAAPPVARSAAPQHAMPRSAARATEHAAAARRAPPGRSHRAPCAPERLLPDRCGSGSAQHEGGAPPLTLALWLRMLHAAGLLRPRGGGAEGGTRLGAEHAAEAFVGALSALDGACALRGAEQFSESICRLALHFARLAGHNRRRAERLLLADGAAHPLHPPAAAAAAPAAAAESVEPQEGGDACATRGDTTAAGAASLMQPADGACSGVRGADAQAVWADEATLMSNLPTVLAKLVVCTESPAAGLASGRLWASQAIVWAGALEA